MTFKAVISPFKNIWQVIGAMFLLNLISSYYFWPDVISSWEYFIKGSVWGTTIWTTQSVGHSAIFKYLDEVQPWKKGLIKRGLLTILSIGTYAVIAYGIVQSTMYFIFVDQFTLTELWESTISSSVMTMKIAYSVSFILSFFGFARAMVRMELEKEKIQTEMMTYKYESLRNQINPHFLFNSFNVLSELVYEDQKLAVKFIHQLSDLYRYVLDAKDKELISLKEELKFIESFTFLLKTRFENRVEFNIDVPYKEEDYIIPMALQLLVENCIKHNEALSNSPLIITITKEDNYIKVSNNLQKKQNPEASTKIGLSNLKERYEFFNDRGIKVSESENEYCVCIPVLKLSESK